MKKRMYGMVLAAALVVTQAVSAFAAPSRTTDVKPAGDSVGYYETKTGTEETFAYLDETVPEVKKMIMDINKGVTGLESIAEAAPELKEELEGKSLVTGFFDLEPINGGIKTADGKYIVTFSVPELTKSMTNVRLLHYSTDRNVWEIITPNDVNYEQKQITAEFIDLSPVAVIADIDKSQTEASGTSPQTGVSAQWPIYGVLALMLMGISAAFFARNKRSA